MGYEKIEEWMFSRFASEQDRRKAPKYEALKNVILLAIREKVLLPGDRLPSEQQLGQYLPVSQITVRRSYAELEKTGIISREHGRGTFVSDSEQSVSNMWHFRFLDPVRGGLMPIYNRILSLTLHTDATLAASLGGESQNLIRIERTVNIGSLFNCYSELYLPENRFSGIMRLPHSQLERVNLKDILTELFNAPTLQVNQNLTIASLPERAAKIVERPAGNKAMCLRITGFTFDDVPISRQDIWIPETDYELNLPASVSAGFEFPPIEAASRSQVKQDMSSAKREDIKSTQL